MIHQKRKPNCTDFSRKNSDHNFSTLGLAVNQLRLKIYNVL